MKLKIYAEETYTTTITREPIVIDTDNYPELAGMSEDEVSDFIDNNAWEMKSCESEDYSSLGEELSGKDIQYDSISGEQLEFYTSAE